MFNIKINIMRKRITTLCFVLFISVFSISQTNYALYELNDIFPACISDIDDRIYGVEWDDTVKVIKAFKLHNGEEIKRYHKNIPKNPIEIMLAHPKKHRLYFITARKIDDTGIRYADALYEMNTKNGKIKKLRNVYYNYRVPNKIGMVENLLVFTTLRNPTYVFDLKKKQFRNLNPNTHYQMVSIAPKQKGFIMMNVNRLDDNNIAIHFMDKKNNMSDVIGYITQKLTIYSDKQNLQLPSISLTDSTYNWIEETIRYNSMPLYNFEVAMRAFWLKQAVSFDKAYKISGFLAANKSHLIAKSGSKLYVYNYKTPKRESSFKLSTDDVEQIKNYIDSTGNYQQSVISSEYTDKVFDAVFYEVFKKNKFQHIATQFHGNYFELNHYEMLIDLLQADFKLKDKKSAETFQLALNDIFPVKDFNKSLIKYEQIENKWRFVRGEAFQKKYGIMVSTNNEGKITEIKYVTDLYK